MSWEDRWTAAEDFYKRGEEAHIDGHSEQALEAFEIALQAHAFYHQAYRAKWNLLSQRLSKEAFIEQVETDIQAHKLSDLPPEMAVRNIEGYSRLYHLTGDRSYRRQRDKFLDTYRKQFPKKIDRLHASLIYDIWQYPDNEGDLKWALKRLRQDLKSHPEPGGRLLSEPGSTLGLEEQIFFLLHRNDAARIPSSGHFEIR